MDQNITIDTDEILVRRGYYNSGAIMWEDPYVNGRMHGIGKGFYPSGALHWEAPFKNGKKHGIEKFYYESGALRWDSPYVNGMQHGIEKVYYDKDNANIRRLTLYDKNRNVTTMKI